MRSHSCVKKAVVMPVSVPVQSRVASKACRGGQRRCSRTSPATGGAVLYRSLMHLEEQEVVTRGSAAAREVEGHYTPPLMLCPIRAGPGLYCSVTTRRQRRAQTVQLHSPNNGLSDLVAMETPTAEINKPRINVGRGFQAEIPPLRNHKYAHSDSQNALWLWTPCDELEKPVNQQRVTTLLTMARSSVVPGGGASPEHALHVLSQSAGDFLLTLEKLLSTPESSDQSHAGQLITDVAWSAGETTSLVKSLRLHRKDFSRVQRAVQTKSVSQCVEFYYLWKKKLSLRARPPAGLTVTLPETNVRSSSDDFDPERPSALDKRS
ncbi:zinc finger protein 541-like isoform X2 [Hippoglossus hippoglossus]|uniref:zinc finger protein 541-like isoform X2 n=1 Tax=Hippoglossus hippoglossus TaxID=8267 RepID=UPI00148CD58A|nr:zinc finger protein 541-like isoform X2 [Hippoglossus hippoglossus]XP_034467453.1 zinc finger protein 541-like isoform X2 [Hippoglossus hippoglossus]